MKKSKYVCVVTVADMQSISNAAKALGMSQPALTKTISNIEEEYGVKLFNRSTIPLQLTQAGKTFVTEARRIIRMEDTIKREMAAHLDTQTTQLTVACGFTASTLWMPFIQKSFNQKYPNVKLSLKMTHGPATELALKSRDADLAFSQLPLRYNDLEHVELPSLPRVFLVPYNHSILEGINISNNSLDNPVSLAFSQLNGQDFISLREEEPDYTELINFCNQAKIKPNKIITTNNYFSVYRSVLAGLGIAISSLIYATPHKCPPPVICSVDGYEPQRLQYVISYCKATKPLNKMTLDFLEICKDVIGSYA